jgi:branched-chain amino acid transport system ATP-binding protein
VTLLEVTEVTTGYGPIVVNREVSLTLAAGEVVTLLGPNGAGKTTLLRAISGLVRLRAGRIRFDGAEIGNRPAEQLARQGVVMVPEGRRIFPRLTVQENLRLGAYGRDNPAEVRADLGLMEQLFPALAQKRHTAGGLLSGGQQQMLAIARGLMARPRLLLLDEPSLGLSPRLVEELRGVVRMVRDRFGAAVLLVEQNAGLALDVAERGYVMQSGRITASGSSEELRGQGFRLYLAEPH